MYPLERVIFFGCRMKNVVGGFKDLFHDLESDLGLEAIFTPTPAD
jgi:hypothetical protein